jgi:acyl phosphate:glycerol-3-phosphate acyltransferase
MVIPIIVSYLLGSIPVGYLIVNARTGGDIRKTGSGGTGATNVSRRAGKGAGILTLILDALKGSAAVIIATIILRDINHALWWIGIAGIVAILGHIFPVWLGFRGGKGVATGVGVFLILTPVAVLLSGVLFLIVVVFTRYVSLGSMIGALSMPALALLLNYGTPLVFTTLFGALLIIYAHRQNIQRLMTGTENKFR